MIKLNKKDRFVILRLLGFSHGMNVRRLSDRILKVNILHLRVMHLMMYSILSNKIILNDDRYNYFQYY